MFLPFRALHVPSSTDRLLELPSFNFPTFKASPTALTCRPYSVACLRCSARLFSFLLSLSLKLFICVSFAASGLFLILFPFFVLAFSVGWYWRTTGGMFGVTASHVPYNPMPLHRPRKMLHLNAMIHAAVAFGSLADLSNCDAVIVQYLVPFPVYWVLQPDEVLVAVLVWMLLPACCVPLPKTLAPFYSNVSLSLARTADDILGLLHEHSCSSTCRHPRSARRARCECRNPSKTTRKQTVAAEISVNMYRTSATRQKDKRTIQTRVTTYVLSMGRKRRIV